MKNLNLIDLSLLTFTVFYISDAKKERKKERQLWQACLTNHYGLTENDRTSSDGQVNLTQNAFV